MRLKLPAVFLLTLIGWAVAACDQGGRDTDTPPGEPVGDAVVTIADLEYQGGSITVEEGTTVTWVWQDAPIEHNVVSDDGSFESPLQAEGEWSHTFDEAGTFPYHCQPHPFMTGTITVVEANA